MKKLFSVVCLLAVLCAPIMMTGCGQNDPRTQAVNGGTNPPPTPPPPPPPGCTGRGMYVRIPTQLAGAALHIVETYFLVGAQKQMASSPSFNTPYVFEAVAGQTYAQTIVCSLAAGGDLHVVFVLKLDSSTENGTWCPDSTGVSCKPGQIGMFGGNFLPLNEDLAEDNGVGGQNFHVILGADSNIHTPYDDPGTTPPPPGSEDTIVFRVSGSGSDPLAFLGSCSDYVLANHQCIAGLLFPDLLVMGPSAIFGLHSPLSMVEESPNLWRVTYSIDLDANTDPFLFNGDMGSTWIATLAGIQRTVTVSVNGGTFVSITCHVQNNANGGNLLFRLSSAGAVTCEPG